MYTASLCGLGTAVSHRAVVEQCFRGSSARRNSTRTADGIVAVGAVLDLCILHATSAIHR